MQTKDRNYYGTIEKTCYSGTSLPEYNLIGLIAEEN